MYSISVTEGIGDEQTFRFRAGNIGPAVAEDSGARTIARLGHRATLETSIRRCSASERRLTVSGAPQIGAGWLDHGRVEAKRKQPARQVLFANALRAEAPGKGSRKLGAAVR